MNLYAIIDMEIMYILVIKLNASHILDPLPINDDRLKNL